MKPVRNLTDMQIRVIFVANMGAYMYVNPEHLKANGLKTFLLKCWQWRFLYPEGCNSVYDLNGINVSNEAEYINYVGRWLHHTGFSWSVRDTAQDGTVFTLHEYNGLANRY